jgi:colanic acid biosynthesis glycosyl transferase WcaI
LARIFLHSLVFPPDSVSTARLLGELVRGLRGCGHAVDVLTAAPHYRPDADLAQWQPLRKRWAGLVQTSDHVGARVWHIHVGSRPRHLTLRLAALGLFHVISVILALRLARRADVIVAVSPPPSLALVGAAAAAVWRVPMVYHAQELYPDFLVNQGYLRNRFLIRVARWLERLAYRRSARIVVIGETFRRRLMELGVPADKIAVVENFCLDREVEGTATPLRVSPGDRLFCAYYGGNIGLSQDWELFLAAAEALRGQRVEFLVSGDGARLTWLRDQVRRRGLASVQVVGARPLREVAGLLADCDLVVIPMRAMACMDTFPSKLYSAFAAGRPVLAAADAASDFAAAIRDTGSGVVVAPGDVEGFVRELRALMTDRQRLLTMAERSASAAAHNTPAICVARFDALLADLLDGNRGPSADRLPSGVLHSASTTRVGGA